MLLLYRYIKCDSCLDFVTMFPKPISVNGGGIGNHNLQLVADCS